MNVKICGSIVNPHSIFNDGIDCICFSNFQNILRLLDIEDIRQRLFIQDIGIYSLFLDVHEGVQRKNNAGTDTDVSRGEPYATGNLLDGT